MKRQRKVLEERDCFRCGVIFIPIAPHNRYCSKHCRKRVPPRFLPKQCKQCNSEFQPRTAVHLFCSVNCRNAKSFNRPRRDKNIYIPTSTVGAMSELIVAVDLMKLGKHVFRALSPSCPCDLVILEGGKLITVEVRTGVRLKSGSLSYRKDRMQSTVFGIVVHGEEKVVYEPPFADA